MLSRSLLHAFPFAQKGKMRPAEKRQVKEFLPLVNLSRSKQDPFIHGHGSQYLYGKNSIQEDHSKDAKCSLLGCY